jgi:hypothetical protein
MTLANLDLGELRSKVLAAYRADDPTLQRFRVYARRLRAEVRPLRAYAVNAVSFVSADGGDNRLRLDPAAIELVRVVDSRGNQCALDAVPSTVTLEELEQRAVSGSQSVVLPLERLCRDLGKRLGDLSYIIGGVGQPGKTTGALRCYRDMVEWAVLYDLVANPTLRWGGDTILIRDGLLRTKSFKRIVFPLIDKRLREAVAAHAKRNVTLSLVGVAKQNAVLGRLAVALELEGTFYRPFPCYVRVPEDIERECYNFDRTWLDTYETSEPEDDGRRLYQSLGRLFLVKFGDQSLDPVWPVDIAEWQVKDAEKVLGQLTVDAQQGFPIPDYPMTIQRAHDFAKLTGLTITLLEDLLLEGMSQDLTSDERDRLLRLKYLGRSLAALRYKEG